MRIDCFLGGVSPAVKCSRNCQMPCVSHRDGTTRFC